ncbi:hypothetical protein MMC17_008316 [Xylographa soralifera]|nr:hypothetical protein [Xylographa soralifera]
MSLIKRIFKHDKNNSITDSPAVENNRNPRLSSGIICLDKTYENIIVHSPRTGETIVYMPKTKLHFFPDGSRESFAEAAVRLADRTTDPSAQYKIGYPTRLQNYPSPGSGAGHFEKPVSVDDLKPVFTDTVDRGGGETHTTAWFVGVCDDLLAGGSGPCFYMYNTRPAPLTIQNAILVLPSYQARVVASFMVGLTRDRLPTIPEEDYDALIEATELLEWLERRS